MTSKQSLPTKLLLLGALYAAQGLPFGFFTQAVPVVMRSQGWSLEWIGLSSLLALPWAFKWVWAPLMDRVYSTRWGRRRSWILPIQGLSVLCLSFLALIGDGFGLLLLLAGCFLSNLFAASQDVATDGLAVEILEERERGWGNGVQVAAYRGGMILGGGVLLWMFELSGWRLTLGVMALLLAFAPVPVLLFREAPSGAVAEKGSHLSYLRRPGVWRWLGVLALFKVGDSLGSGMLRPFLIDRGVTMGEIGFLVGGVGSVAGLLGALVGGWSLRFFSHERSLLVLGMISASGTFGYALAVVAPSSLTLYGALSAWEHFSGGLATAALFSLMMGFCRQGHEGGDYTLQASVVVLASGLAHAMSGFSAAGFGYFLHFLCSGVLGVIGAVAAWAVVRRSSANGRAL